jgi:hypothetical protein
MDVHLTRGYVSDKYNGGKWMMDVGSEVMRNIPTDFSPSQQAFPHEVEAGNT